jgi:hypothetical protein
MKTIIICLLLTWTIFQQSTQNYNSKIEKYFEDNAKIVVSVKSVRVDTTVTKEQYKKHYEIMLKKECDSNKEFYAKQIKKYTDQGYGEKTINKYKAKLDSANRGLCPNDLMVPDIKKVVNTPATCQQITVKYETVKGQPIRVQKFVTKIVGRDTTLIPIDTNLKQYLETHL